MTATQDLPATQRKARDEVGWNGIARDVVGRAGDANVISTVDPDGGRARERLVDVRTYRRSRRAVSRGVLAALSLTVPLASCGSSDDPGSASGATRPQPPTQRSGAPPPSPDAGIPEGHAAADARARRCRAAHPPQWRFWRYCDRYAR